MTIPNNASLITSPLFMEWDINGKPLAGGQLFTYAAGGSIPLATYTDATLTVTNPNPVVLDNLGKAQIWFGSQAYKLNLTDSLGVQQPDYPIDNIILNTQASLSQLLGGTGVGQGQALVGFSSSTSYPAGTLPYALALATAATNGAGLIGYASSNAYAAGTVGAGLNAIATSGVTFASIIAQTGTSFSTSGTGSAYTLTSGQAFTANAAMRRLNINFTAAGIGTPTLAVDTAPALPLVAYNSAGVLVAYQPYLGQVADVQCDGTHWIVLDPISKGTTAGGRFRNLIVTYGQTSGTVSITADEVTVSDLNGNQTRLSSVNVSAALSTVGAINGTDGSTQTAGNFYTVWVAYNPTTRAVGALISAEPTSPTTALLGPATPISGYTQYACVSINKIKALAPAYWLPGIQTNFDFSPTTGAYLTAPVLMFSGALGTWTGTIYSAQTVRGNSSSVPYHASKLKGILEVLASVGYMLAPNNSYSGSLYDGSTNPAPVMTPMDGSAPEYPFEFVLESNSIYACFNGTGYVWLERWTLNL
jgi:hypothetical protein